MAVPPCLATSHGLLPKNKEEIFNIIDSAILIAAMRWPEDLAAHRHKIADLLLMPPEGLLGSFSDSDDSWIPKNSDITAENKSTSFNEVAVEKSTSHSDCVVGDKKTQHQITSKQVSVPFEKRIQRVGLDEEAVEKKLQLTNRKPRQQYEQLEDAKTQKRIKVTESRDVPTKRNNGANEPSLDCRSRIQKQLKLR